MANVTLESILANAVEGLDMNAAESIKAGLYALLEYEDEIEEM